MGIEFELKYAATPEAQEQILQNTAELWQTIRMETTYYDTHDNKLSGRHYTLRRRMENGKSVCTVKTPVGDHDRGEWEVECDDILEAVPALCKLGAPADLVHLISGGLSPVCGARFTRRAGLVNFMDAVLEIALDEGILFNGDREIPLCEVEVELKSGSRSVATMYGAMLAKIHALKPQPLSKFRRARDLREET